jgi:sigma-B regulation protein RsbU (phosphoserine phosphatase)
VDSGPRPHHEDDIVAGEVVAGPGLTIEMVRPLLAPFDVPDGGLHLVVEDFDGRPLGTAGSPATGAAVEASQPIRCGPAKAAIGRVVGRGEGPLVGAVVASLASSLATIASTAHEHEPGGDAAHRLEAELALGRRIQRSFVPLSAPTIPGYEIASHYEAAREVGGDFFDIFRMRTRTGQLGLVIADVTGKGVAAALLMAFARPLIRSALDHAREPALALNRVNRILVEERRSALFITALVGIVELRTGRFRLANAGHEPPLHVPADGGPIRWMPVAGSLLGAFADLELADCDVTLEPGDLLLLYTDGVTDARAPSGERFGDERLLGAVESARSGAADEVVAAVSQAYHQFQGDMPAADDVTIVAVRREPPRVGRRRP